MFLLKQVQFKAITFGQLSLLISGHKLLQMLEKYLITTGNTAEFFYCITESLKKLYTTQHMLYFVL